MPAQRKLSSKTRRTVSKSKRKVTKRKPAHKVKKVVLGIFVVLFASAVISLYSLGNYLNKNFAQAQSQTHDFQNPNYYTILYITVTDLTANPVEIEKAEFIVADLESKKTVTYRFTGDYKLNYGPEFGEAELSKAFAYGSLNSNAVVLDGTGYVNRVFENFFAFTIDKYVYADRKNDPMWSAMLHKGEFLPLLVSYLKNISGQGNYTNLELDGTYKLAKFVASLPDDRKLTVSQASFSADSTDSYFRELTINSKFAQEGKSVAILNASKVAGIAGLGARYVANLGGRVVAVDNSSTKFSESFIVSDSSEDFSAVRLSKAFDIEKIIDKQTASKYVSASELYRADIVVLLAN